MSQKIDLMNEITTLQANVNHDTETRDWIAGLDPANVTGFEVIEGQQITVRVKTSDGQTFERTYTDVTVFGGIIVEMINLINTNLTTREQTIDTKEQELKALL